MSQPRAARGAATLPYAAAFGAGLAMASGQAPWGLWPVSLAGAAALCALVGRAQTARAATLRAWTGGVGHFGLSLSWIVEPFLIDAPRHGWMAPFALVLLAGGLALFWGAAGAVSRFGVPRALTFAVALAGAEALRGVVLTGFPWAEPGHALIGTPAAQLAALGGPAALNLLILIAAALPAAFSDGVRQSIVGALTGAAVSAGLIAGAFGFGLARIDRLAPDARAAPGAPLLRLVQPNAGQQAKWDPELARAHLENLLSLSSEPSSAPLALIVWPETAVPYLVTGASPLTAEIGASGGGVPILAGIQRSDDGIRFFNSLLLIDADGGILAGYDKHHLVPFGEYVPFGDLLWRLFGISAFAAQQGAGYAAGPGPMRLDLGPALGQAVPLICYEAVFPGIPPAAGRGRFLLQVTNDAWFGTESGPWQHLALARLRAVEQGLPLMRAANTGVTAGFDALGRPLGSLPFGTAGTLDLALPPPLPPTAFARTGPWPVFVLIALLAAGLVVNHAWRRP